MKIQIELEDLRECSHCHAVYVKDSYNTIKPDKPWRTERTKCPVCELTTEEKE